jgi:acyl transferase domain-containing protein/NAD(P)-dependent dehydrogenase (short-subunit alcohol dehydrogenase family)/SAM-dependent methyltransferase/acyl carrier protein
MPADEPSTHSDLLRRSLHAIEVLEDRVEQLVREPIAVVGIGCRFPGADGPHAYWRLLRDGIDAVGPIPPDRAHLAAGARFGGFLAETDGFDADFFSIAPREAEQLDPQQRLLLEIAWEALEDAQIPPETLFGTPTGVFVGMSTFDYALRLFGGGKTPDAYTATGSLLSPAAGRLAYVLGLQGPALVVDTACSSSLVAVHLACQSLRAGECDAALAAGVNRILEPSLAMGFKDAGMLASDGRCKTFSAAADGFVRSEGCGIVVLKRLSDARAAGDHVHAVIRGSAINQDGRSSGLMAPNGPAQQIVLRQALRNAGLDPAEVGYVEAHGTGTRLGDPIEIGALAAVFGPGRDAARPLVVGAVKTNVGHMEGASGIGGLIKAILAVEHGEIPRNLHLAQPSPEMPWAEIPLRLPQQTLPWPDAARRIAGVSAFGFAGTNAHVLVEQTPTIAPVASVPLPVQALLLSARSDRALRDLAARYESLLRTAPAIDDLCHAANTGRSHLAARLAVTGRTPEELAARLRAFRDGKGEAPPSSDLEARLRRAAAQWAEGGALDWNDIDPGPRRRVELPTYPWQRKRHGVPPRATSAPSERNWSTIFRPGDMALITEHRIFGNPVVPASAWLDLLLMAAQEIATDQAAVQIRDFRISTPLTCDTDDAIDIQVLLTADAEGGHQAQIQARRGDTAWNGYAAARIVAAQTPSAVAPHGLFDAPESAERYYADATRRGLDFGPSFRRVLHLQLHGEAAVGKIAFDRSPSDGSRPDPTVWDACLQLADAVVQQLNSGATPLPSGIGSLWLDGRLPEGPVTALVTCSPAGHGWRASCVLSDATGRIVAALDGIDLQAAAVPTREDERYRIAWQEDAILAPFELGAVLDPIWQRSRHDPVLQAFCAADPVLNDWSAFHAARALAEFGWTSGDRTPLTTLADRLGVLPKHRRLLQTLLDLSAPALIPPPMPDGAARHEFQLLGRCGPALAAVLRGEADPVELLFPAGDPEALSGLYGQSPGARLLNDTVGQAVDAFRRTRGGRLRVLECGAGSGSTSAAILDAAGDGIASYVFTDVSPRFAARAATALGQRPGLAFKLFDLERDPVAQGFAPGSFDLIVAVNVLHATSDLARSLDHVRGLLAEGGMLLLVEATETRAWVELTFGLVDGWHRHEDTRIRDRHTLLDQAAWQQLLQAAGFDRIEAGAPASAGIRLLLPQTILVARQPERPRSILLLGGGDLARSLAADLHQRGASCRLAEDLIAADVAAFDTVLDLRPLAAIIKPTMTAAALRERLRHAVGSVLSAAQACAGGPALLVATRATGVAGLAQAAISGLIRSAVLEPAHGLLRQVDLDPDHPEQDVAALLHTLFAQGSEPQCAWRDGRRFVPRLQREALAGPAPRAALDPVATYLVAGGTSGLGLLSAQWLAGAGARIIVIAGRRGEADPRALAAIRATGATVRLVRTDLTDAEAVERLFHDELATLPRVAGMILAAGVLDDGVVDQLTWDRVEAVLAPKALGAWSLWHHLGQRRPDWLLLYSSAVAMLGNPGQANHGAANAFLDAFAVMARDAGVPTVAVDWGPVAEVGAALRPASAATLRGLAMLPLAAIEVAGVLDRLIDELPAQAGIFTVDWRHSSRTVPLFAEVAAPVDRSGTTATAEVEPVEPPQGRADILRMIQRETAAILGLDGLEAVSPSRGFFDLGMDSLTSLELRERLQQVFGVAQPSTFLFTYPTPAKLAEHLAGDEVRDRPVEAPAPIGVEPDRDALEAALEAELAWVWGPER